MVSYSARTWPQKRPRHGQAQYSSYRSEGNWHERWCWDQSWEDSRWYTSQWTSQSSQPQEQIATESNWWSQPTGAQPWACEDWVQKPTGSHWCTLLWLHSYCGKPCHVESLIQDLEQWGLQNKHLRIVAPAAPLRGEILGWFDYVCEGILQGRDQDDAHQTQLREQRQRLLCVLEDELERLPPQGRLVLGGLSQGASMALDLSLHMKGSLVSKLAAVVSRRGMLQKETLQDLSADWSPEHLEKLPILATHGVEDDWVPMQPARASYRFLEQNAPGFSFRSFPGLAHNGYNEQENNVIVDFLCHQLVSW